MLDGEVYSAISLKSRYEYMSRLVEFSVSIYTLYSSKRGSLPRIAVIVANSAEPKNTDVFLPNRFGKFRVDVDIAVDPSAI